MKNSHLVLGGRNIEGLGDLPFEALATEMAVGGRLGEPRCAERKLLDNSTRAAVEVVLDDLDHAVVLDVAGAVRVDEDGDGLHDADGVRELDEAALAETRVDEALGDPARHVGPGAVDLGVVLAREASATVRTPATIGIDDDLAASETGVTSRPANDETARRVDEIYCVVIEVLGGDNLLDNTLHELVADSLKGHTLSMLGRDDDSVNANWDDARAVLTVLHRDLSLRVRAEPVEGSVLAKIGHAGSEAASELVGHRHKLRRLIASVPKHDALVAGGNFFLAQMHGLGNVRGLLLQPVLDRAGLPIDACSSLVVADLSDGIADDLLHIDLCLCVELTKDHHEVGLGGRLASNLGVGILLQASIQDRVRNEITELVRVALADRFRGEEEACHGDLRVFRRGSSKGRLNPNALAGFSSAKVTNEENYCFMKFMRAVIGTNNVDHCARLCHASTVAGLARAFGSGAMTNSIDELEHADCILVTGSNTTETHPIISLKIKRAVRMHGAKLIVVDPRAINLTHFATMHIRQTSGTDVAFYNAMMSVIIREGLHKESFIRDFCENYEEFEEEVLKWTPERAAEICGVNADDIVRAARIYATAKNGSIIFSMGITQHSHGTDNVLSLANMCMLCGHIGRPSTGVNPLRGQNNVQGACDLGALPNVYSGYQAVTNPAFAEKFGQAWGRPMSTELGLPVTEAINAAYDGRVKGIYIMGENPAVSDPNLAHAKDALRKLDFLVVQDIFMTPTTEFAHVVLPAGSFIEKEGTFTNTERRVMRVRKCIDMPGEAREDWDITCDLARRMGYDMGFTSSFDIMEEIRRLTPSYAGMQWSRLEATGGLQWPCPSEEHPGTMYLHKDGKFARGKGHFYALPYRPTDEVPDEEYPLVLSTGRLLYHFHTGTMSRKTDGLNDIAPTTHAEFHANDAKRLGVHDGERIAVVTRRGRIEVTATVPSRVKEGMIFMPFHYEEAPANALTNDALDPIAKIPEFKACACRIEKL
eukprot:gnl/Trimastix_PCT/120.p1 GENE.gnl/Trimastix_PCT/120~~gnl/Trimastix_PCT/120.p1  ORF type:complete len:1000 (+),score=301.91 gnl/Trimastix_PCT/120:28-3000(+)